MEAVFTHLQLHSTSASASIHTDHPTAPKVWFLNYISPVVWMPLHAGRHTLFDLPLFTASRCRPNPCQNGGSCMSPKRSSFQCFCPDGYNGKFCEVGECNSLSVINRRNTRIPWRAWLDVSFLLGPNDCYRGDGESYRGTVSVAVDGEECLDWNSYFILQKGSNPFKEYAGFDGIGPHNHCRWGGVWCKYYTHAYCPHVCLTDKLVV